MRKEEETNIQEEWFASEEEAEEETSYSWGTMLVALLLALSLLGSFLWRAFPPAAILGRTSPGGAPRATPDLPARLLVPASAGWVDTGLVLTKGAYRISAQGQISLDQSTPENQYMGPEGGLSRCQSVEERPCAMSGAPYGALVGRIDNGEPFRVGAVLVLEIGSTGRLQLAVNDRRGEFHDNEGSFVIRVERFGQDGFKTAARWLTTSPIEIWPDLSTAVQSQSSPSGLWGGESRAGLSGSLVQDCREVNVYPLY